MNDSAKTRKILTTRLNYKVLVLIFGLAVIYQIVLNEVDHSYFRETDGLYMAGIAICAISSFLVSKKYRGSEVFGRSYFFLGIGFVCWFIGDIGYYYYEFVLQEDAWPNPFDVFFIGANLFTSFHLILNTRYFRPQWNNSMKVLLIAVPIVLVAIYTIVAYQEWGNYEELPFDLFYGGIFTVAVGIELGLVILGASVFRKTILRDTWLLLLSGFFLWSMADIWFNYIEIFEEFSQTHPANTLWMTSFMVVIYALYKHNKVI